MFSVSDVERDGDYASHESRQVTVATSLHAQSYALASTQTPLSCTILLGLHILSHEASTVACQTSLHHPDRGPTFWPRTPNSSADCLCSTCRYPLNYLIIP